VPVLLAALGMLVVSLDSAVNVALPTMAEAFGIGPAEIRWVIICYVLSYAITSVVAGVVADRLGPVPVYTVGMWLSVVAFLLYALVTSYPLMLATRVAQGLAGGLVYGTAPALVTLSLPLERHGRGLGALAAGQGVGGIAGPLIGGAIVAWGWPWVFLFRLPLAVGAGVVAPWLQPSLAGVGAWRLPPRREWIAWPVMQGLTLAALASWAQFSVWLLAPFYLVSLRELSAATGGLLFMLASFGVAVGGPVGGWLTDRIGRRKAPLLTGLALETLALAAVIWIEGLPVVALGGLCFLTGFLGSAQIVGFALIKEHHPAQLSGTAIGFVNGMVTGAGALFQPLVGLLLDLAWTGETAQGARVYTPEAYRLALTSLIACGVSGVVCVLAVRETFCRPRGT